MAVSAVFKADFEQFHTAVQKATGEFKDFASGADAVGRSLNRMVDQFSGRKLVQDATLMVKAVEDIGGVSKLTEAEMKKLGNTVTEATTKMRAMGIDIPQKFRDIEEATKGATKAGEGWSSWLKQTNTLLGALGIGLSVGAVVSFGKEIFRMGDEFQKMADKAGMSTTEVQRLSFVADQTGVAFEALIGATQNVQQRIGEGDKGLVAAVAELGLNLDEIKRQTPYQQLLTFATAIAGIEDPTKRASISADIFGKTWKEITPAIVNNMAQIAASAPVMEEAVVHALDKAGDQFNEFALTMKVLAANAYLWVGKVFDNIVIAAYKAAASLNDAIAALGRMVDKIPGSGKVIEKLGIDFSAATRNAQWFRDAADSLAHPIEEATTKTQQFVGPLKDVAATTEKAAKGTKAVKEEVEKLLPSQQTWALGIGQLNNRMVDLEQHLHDQREMFQDLTTSVDELATSQLRLIQVETQTGAVIGGTVVPMMGKLPEGLHGMTDAADDAGTSISKMGSIFGNVFGSLNDIFQRAFEGGGNIAGAIKSWATNALKVALSFIPVVGPAISQFAGAIVAGLTKLFKSAESAINPLRKAFVDAAGGLDALRDKAFAAGKTLDELLNAKNAEQYKKAIDDLNNAFDEHAKDIDRAKALMEEYGISIEETGQKWRDQQLQEQTKGLIDDYRIMVDVLGLSVAGAAEKMAGKFNDFLHTAQKVGFEIPAEMKPILEQMVHLGLLTDEQGNAYEDLEDTGVTFAETFAKSIDRLIDKFDEFLKRLNLVPSNVRVDVDTYHHDHYDETTPATQHTGGLIMHGGGIVPGKIMPFPIPTAHNGLAPGERLIKAQTGEAMLSRSDVARLGGAAGFSAFRTALRGGAGSGDSSSEVAAELKGLRQELVADRLTSAQKLARAVRDEVQKVSARRR